MILTFTKTVVQDGSVELITQDVQGSYYKFLVTSMSNPYGFAQAEVYIHFPCTSLFHAYP
jgi:hypothetical protein